MGNGEQCVAEVGVPIAKTKMSYVVNLVMLRAAHLITSIQGLGQCGWMVWYAVVMRDLSLIVPVSLWVTVVVGMIKTSLSNVSRRNCSLDMTGLIFCT